MMVFIIIKCWLIFYKTIKILDRLNNDRRPFHTDLVAENIVKSGDKIYLID